MSGTKTMRLKYFEKNGYNVNCLGSYYNSAGEIYNIYHDTSGGSDDKVYVMTA